LYAASNNPWQLGGRGRAAIDAIAMPLDPAFGIAMVVVFFQDWRCHEYYSYAGNLYCHQHHHMMLRAIVIQNK